MHGKPAACESYNVSGLWQFSLMMDSVFCEQREK